MCTIRNLRADEIECRPKQVTGNSLMVLLYKDARCDMKILDETFGVYGWKRIHEVINGNLFCTVEIRNPETGEWIKKQDVGTESNTEKEKGEASDAFKRACTNVGIGRELYSTPPIWVNLKNDEVAEKNNVKQVKSSVRFYVSEIKTDEDKQITFINIIDKDGTNRFTWSKANLKYHELITKVKIEDANATNVAMQAEENQKAESHEVQPQEKITKPTITKKSYSEIVNYITDNFPETQRKTILDALLNKWGLEKLNYLKEEDVPKFLTDLEKAKPKADEVA